MSVTQKLEDLVLNIKQDKTTEKFQQQYSEMLTQGLIQRKGYNLAGINVIGHDAPSTISSNIYNCTSNSSN